MATRAVFALLSDSGWVRLGGKSVAFGLIRLWPTERHPPESG